MSRFAVLHDDPLTIDPWSPCHLYVRNGPAGTVERSDDMGRTFGTVFSVADPSSLSISPLSIRRAGDVGLFDMAGAHAIAHSADSGAHWSQQGTDLPVAAASGQASPPGQAPVPYTECATCMQALAFAPSDPDVGYAALSSQQGGGLTLGGTSSHVYRTRDGGATWSLAGTPGVGLFGVDPRNQRQLFVVDPADPDHIDAVAGAGCCPGHASAGAVVKSHDGGTTWTMLAPPRSDPPNDIIATGAGGLYLVYGEHMGDLGPGEHISESLGVGGISADYTLNFTPATQLVATFDDGAHWQTLAAPSVTADVGSWSLAFDPTHPGAGLAAAVKADSTLGVVLLLLDTHDGFRTVDTRRTVVLAPPALKLSDCTFNTCVIRVTAGAAGEFYIDVQAANSSYAGGQETVLALRPPLAALPDLAPVTSFATASGGSAGTGAPAGSTPVDAKLRALCQMPRGNASSSTGSLAYDGQSLLYTDQGDDSTLPDTAVIRKFDPTTCSPTGVILVQFDANDLFSARVANPRSSAVNARISTYPPEIDDMTYDASRQVLWVALRDPNGGPIQGALFAVRVTDLGPQPVEHAKANLAFMNGCGEILAYDVTTDNLYTCDLNAANQRIAALSAKDGRHVNSCLDSWGYAGTPVNQIPSVGWVVTRPGQVYTEFENDRTMIAVEMPATPSVPCSFSAVYNHPLDGEPSAEDEQLACDSQTFSSGTTTRTVVWIRNTGDTVFSYDVPGGKCPLPTFTTYIAPHLVAAGSSIALCASTTVHYLEGYKSLPAGLPVRFSVGAQPLGVGYTTGGPEICTKSLANPLPSGHFTVTASFAGTDAYLPSSGSGPLDVVESPAGSNLTPAQPLAVLPILPLPPPGLPQPPSPVQPQGAAQAQAEAQAQAQAQAQSQAQSQTASQLQPGVMTQRQRRVQVATRSQAGGTQTAYQATAVRRPKPAPGLAAAAGLMMVSIGLLVRRPRWAVARSRRRSRGK